MPPLSQIWPESSMPETRLWQCRRRLLAFLAIAIAATAWDAAGHFSSGYWGWKAIVVPWFGVAYFAWRTYLARRHARAGTPREPSR